MDTRRVEDEISVKLLAAAATDEVLVAAAKLGDRPAFVELLERHSNAAFEMVYRIAGHRDHAEDLARNGE